MTNRKPMFQTVAELRARAELSEQRLADLKEALADMRQQRDRWEAAATNWETVAERLTLPSPKPNEKPMTWWRWLRTTR